MKQNKGDYPFLLKLKADEVTWLTRIGLIFICLTFFGVDDWVKEKLIPTTNTLIVDCLNWVLVNFDKITFIFIAYALWRVHTLSIRHTERTNQIIERFEESIAQLEELHAQQSRENAERLAEIKTTLDTSENNPMLRAIIKMCLEIKETVDDIDFERKKRLLMVEALMKPEAPETLSLGNILGGSPR